MKQLFFLGALFVGVPFFLFPGPMNEKQERHIVIVSASYNNEQWCEQSIKTVFSQNYSNYHLIYINDCSTDQTLQHITKSIDEQGWHDKVTLINNPVRRGAMANQYQAIHMCNKGDIIIILDGDDWLAHENVLAYINNVYSGGTIWLTYGQFREYPSNVMGFCTPMPGHIISQNQFRNYQHIPSHLRTFYAALFHQINKEDLMFNGEFLQMDADIAAMFPMIEMARLGHFRFNPEVLLIYNSANSINDYKVSKNLQRQLDLHIRGRRPYQAINELF